MSSASVIFGQYVPQPLPQAMQLLLSTLVGMLQLHGVRLLYHVTEQEDYDLLLAIRSLQK